STPRLVPGTRRTTEQSSPERFPEGHETHWTPLPLTLLSTHIMTAVSPPVSLTEIAWQSGPRALQKDFAWSTLVAPAGVAMLTAIKAVAIVTIRKLPIGYLACPSPQMDTTLSGLWRRAENTELTYVNGPGRLRALLTETL